MNFKELWQGSTWLHSPQLSPWQNKIIAQMRRRAPKVRDQIWILSSGTQSANTVKAIALTRENILCCAEGVNRHLAAGSKDRWLVALPTYHVGGLAIYARAFLNSAATLAMTGKWEPRKFQQTLLDERITLSALVPTQIHDLVTRELKAPQTLRAIVIGGGALDPGLYSRARALGWPLLPSYGLTECASQVATASLASLEQSEFPTLEVLAHARVELREQRVFISSPAVCRWIAVADSDGQWTLEDPRRRGWLTTEDLGEWQGQGLKIIGRRDDVVKILGVLVPILEVEQEARAYFSRLGLEGQISIMARPEPRAGHELVLITDSKQSLLEWQRHLQRFNHESPGPRRLKGFCWVPHIPVNEMGKVRKVQLRELVVGSPAT